MLQLHKTMCKSLSNQAKLPMLHKSSWHHFKVIDPLDALYQLAILYKINEIYIKKIRTYFRNLVSLNFKVPFIKEPV